MNGLTEKQLDAIALCIDIVATARAKQMIRENVNLLEDNEDYEKIVNDTLQTFKEIMREKDAS